MTFIDQNAAFIAIALIALAVVLFGWLGFFTSDGRRD